MKKAIILAVIVFSFISFVYYSHEALGQTETITISTYYPAPVGIYRQLQVLTSGVAGGTPASILLRDDPNTAGNPVISLIDTHATGGLFPSITFQNSAPNNAVDYRIVLRGDNQLNIRGGEVRFADDANTYSRVRVGEIWICTGDAG
ncbi:MAG: hypothetical protein PHV55_02585 [Candidatus Omnitrophica bacterium]|nr:hypothetical protein [Candidatus Omnitrophota bacterium]